MNALIVGSGGREHALAWALRKSPLLDRLLVAPGNGGTAAIAQNVPVAVDDIDAIVELVETHDVELTVVGPEAPLVGGIVDRLQAAGRHCFGPSAGAARLEGSKVFAKEFMKRHGIPTADFTVVDDPEAARNAVRDMGPPVVIKADGLAAGKGVVVARTIEDADSAIEEIMVERKFGESGRRLIVEECLQGQEVSVHAICGDGAAVLFPASQDHKRAFDGDKGPNTGGMGAYAPVPFVSVERQREMNDSIISPTLQGMEKEGHAFSGVLYAGLMMTRGGPKVLEFNVRFGDPETQVLLPLLESDLLPALLESASGSAPAAVAFHKDRFAATVVMVAAGYPGTYEKGKRIEGVDTANGERRIVFHAGTKESAGKTVTAGGRVVAVSAWDDDLGGAVSRAYEGVEKIRFSGARWRTDIARKAL
ncbi:MAG: phosphoribosylamine--glycine ligase [Candidatus Krumholzibacteriia bacterium]